MNICCGDRLLPEDDYKDYDDILLTLNKTTLKFNNEEGKFYVLDTDDDNTDLNVKKKVLDELKLKKEAKEREIQDYLIKIKDLDLKLEQMERLLIQDEKEQEYIEFIAKQ